MYQTFPIYACREKLLKENGSIISELTETTQDYGDFKYMFEQEEILIKNTGSFTQPEKPKEVIVKADESKGVKIVGKIDLEPKKPAVVTEVPKQEIYNNVNIEEVYGSDSNRINFENIIESKLEDIYDVNFLYIVYISLRKLYWKTKIFI